MKQDKSSLGSAGNHAGRRVKRFLLDIAPDDFAGKGAQSGPDFSAGVYAGVYPGVDVFADDSSELASARVNHRSVHL